MRARTLGAENGSVASQAQQSRHFGRVRVVGSAVPDCVAGLGVSVAAADGKLGCDGYLAIVTICSHAFLIARFSSRVHQAVVAAAFIVWTALAYIAVSFYVGCRWAPACV